jgi:hypothetical protein
MQVVYNLPCSPGWIQSITSLSASTALTGITPPPNAFPRIWMKKKKRKKKERKKGRKLFSVLYHIGAVNKIVKLVW